MCYLIDHVHIRLPRSVVVVLILVRNWAKTPASIAKFFAEASVIARHIASYPLDSGHMLNLCRNLWSNEHHLGPLVPRVMAVQRQKVHDIVSWNPSFQELCDNSSGNNSVGIIYARGTSVCRNMDQHIPLVLGSQGLSQSR